MSTPSSWPMKDLTIFEYKYDDRYTNTAVYKLNASKLCEDECHMFFPVPLSEELLIATSLEFITFHPANPKLNDKFNINPIRCGDIELFWCRFPKEFKYVCERVAKVFGMTMQIMPRVMVAEGATRTGTLLEFPRNENILFFQGKRSNNTNKISEECANIVAIGNSLEKLGVE